MQLMFFLKESRRGSEKLNSLRAAQMMLRGNSYTIT